MKTWVLAGLITVAATPFAHAAETTAECQLDQSRRSVEQRIDAPVQPAAPTTAARPTLTQREAAPPPQASADQPVRQAANDRRRGGKRIPDAELIGPRGAL